MTAPTVAQAPVPTPGQPAPDFTLASSSGQQVTLSSLRGRLVLLAFFPLAFTSTCTDEMCAFSEDFDTFASADVVVLPISVDSTASLRAFQTQYALRSDLLSDFKREVSRAYGVLNEERFLSRRSYFLIDRDGIVRWTHVETVSGERRPNAELLAEIAKLG